MWYNTVVKCTCISYVQVGPGGKLRRGDPSGTVGVDPCGTVGVDDDDEDAAVDGLVGRKGESQIFNQSNEWPKQIRRNHALCHNYLVLKFYDF